nr:DUF5814 domain-containing protein [Halegenticoccus soli]
MLKGATIESLYSDEGLSKVDGTTGDRFPDFAANILDCEDEEQLPTGYSERQLVRYLVELRTEGLDPDDIVEVLGDEYMLYVCPDDVLSFLD